MTVEERRRFENWVQHPKTLFQHFVDENIKFLIENGWITAQYEHTEKTQLCLLFHEINSILFLNHFDLIFKEPEYTLPILCMFMDEGKTLEQWTSDHPTCQSFQNLCDTKYRLFFDHCSKWKYFPYNFHLVYDWIHDEQLTLTELVEQYTEYDLGLMVKVFLKAFQIASELCDRLDKMNKGHLSEQFQLYKHRILRHPLKIESLYCQF